MCYMQVEFYPKLQWQININYIYEASWAALDGLALNPPAFNINILNNNDDANSYLSHLWGYCFFAIYNIH